MFFDIFFPLFPATQPFQLFLTAKKKNKKRNFVIKHYNASFRYTYVWFALAKGKSSDGGFFLSRYSAFPCVAKFTNRFNFLRSKERACFRRRLLESVGGKHNWLLDSRWSQFGMCSWFSRLGVHIYCILVVREISCVFLYVARTRRANYEAGNFFTAYFRHTRLSLLSKYALTCYERCRVFVWFLYT